MSALSVREERFGDEADCVDIDMPVLLGPSDRTSRDRPGFLQSQGLISL